MKTPSLAIDRGGRSYRAAQVRAIEGAQILIRLHVGEHIIGERYTTAATFNGHTPIIGAPVYVEVNPADNLTILAVHPSAPADHNLERAWERDGITFAPGRILPVHGGNE